MRTLLYFRWHIVVVLYGDGVVCFGSKENLRLGNDEDFNQTLRQPTLPCWQAFFYHTPIIRAPFSILNPFFLYMLLCLCVLRVFYLCFRVKLVVWVLKERTWSLIRVLQASFQPSSLLARWAPLYGVCWSKCACNWSKIYVVVELLASKRAPSALAIFHTFCSLQQASCVACAFVQCGAALL